MLGLSVKRSRPLRTPVKTQPRLSAKSSDTTQQEAQSVGDRGPSEGPNVMESNTRVQVNWGTINVPTVLSVLAVLWYTATHTQMQDSRLTAIEDGRAAAKTEYSKRIELLEMKVAKMDNLEYRQTTAEAKIDGNNTAVNARLDRQTDALQDIRASLNGLSTSFEVLSTKIDNALPIKKSELATPPPELARRN